MNDPTQTKSAILSDLLWAVKSIRRKKEKSKALLKVKQLLLFVYENMKSLGANSGS